jgi:ubiquinone/menaquinone biosynthesis C-methylase UbiE
MDMTTVELDKEKAEAFAGRMLGMMNEAGLALMTSIGHRTGLWDALRDAPAQTTEQIANSAGLSERYVREWCGAVTTGGILEYDPAAKTYRLPAEHAAFLTRREPQNNIAAVTQYVGLMGCIEDKIVECFQKGGGVPYDAYPRFHEVMAEDSGQSLVPVLIEQVLPLAPGLPEALEKGIDVLDVGCGSGRALLRMAATYPASRFYGFDLSKEATDQARRQAAEQGLTNVWFDVRNVAQLPKGRTFGLITAFDAIHDQAWPDIVLANIYRHLAPGGTFLMQDIKASSYVEKNMGKPIATFLYSISTMHCMTVSLAQGGMGLGTCWGEEKALEMLRAAGFKRTTIEQLPHEIQNQYYVSRKE